jgi:hypothetical protein
MLGYHMLIVCLCHIVVAKLASSAAEQTTGAMRHAAVGLLNWAL